MSVASTDSKGLEPPRSFAGAAPDRLTLLFVVRYCTPLLVLITLASSNVAVPRGRMVALLLAQVAFGLAIQILTQRVKGILAPVMWVSMIGDIAVIGALAAATGGAGSPLVFLFTLEVVAAGILLSSVVGVRLLILSTGAIFLLDLLNSAGLIDGRTSLPRGLQAIAALWLVAGSAIVFSMSNERELKRRNGELATIRRVTLDIEDTLSLEEILADLCRGVVEAFRFTSAAVLLREGEHFVCRGRHGAAGRIGAVVEDAGALREALASNTPCVVPTEESRRDSTLAEVVGTRGYVLVPLGGDGALVATRAGRRGRPGVVRAQEIEALASLAHHAVLALANARMHAAVTDMAIRDPLTKLVNHGEFQRVLAHECARAERFAKGQHGPSVMMVDIDRFKSLNDRFGHPAGDAVLASVARAISGAVRSFDVVARYGGEEFGVVLPETDPEGAAQVAERVRRAVRETVDLPGKGGRRTVTVSIGVASAPYDAHSPADLVARADDALYRSKEGGRDRVTKASQRHSTARRTAVRGASSRPRPARGAHRARAGWRHAPARSSRPTRRTPRAR